MAKDIFHNLVREGLENEGWTITADPYRVKIEKTDFQIDLAAEKFIAAQKGDRKIAVEIKSFLNPSPNTDFYNALGQFLSYRLVLKQVEPDRVLYLAIPLDAYNDFFQETFTQLAIQEYKLKLIVYDSQKGGLTTWQN